MKQIHFVKSQNYLKFVFKISQLVHWLIFLFSQDLQQSNKLIGNTTILIEIDSKQQIDKTVLVYWVNVLCNFLCSIEMNHETEVNIGRKLFILYYWNVYMIYIVHIVEFS